MKSLSFKKLNLNEADVLTKLQMKKIFGGYGDGTIGDPTKCGSCNVKTTDGYWHTVSCYADGGTCPCPGGGYCKTS